jgi:hypothetical protein
MLAATLLAGFAADTFGIVTLLSLQGALYVVSGFVVIIALRQVADAGEVAEPATVHA